MRHSLLLLLALTSLTGCPDPNETGVDTDPDTTQATLDGLEATPITATLTLGSTAQLTVNAHFSDGSTQDVTQAATYRPINASVASVTASGVVTGLSEGDTDLEVTYQGESDTVRLSVTSGSVGGEVRFLELPVAGITVNLSGAATDSATTDIAGRFAFTHLADGNYSVTTAMADAPRATNDTATATVAASAVTDAHINILTAGNPVAADVFEPDDTAGGAGDLAVGVVQHHTLYRSSEPADGGDADWMRVTLNVGTTYELFTAGVSLTSDTVLTLFDATGSTQVAENDDDIFLNSRIQFTPTETGTYLLQVRAYDQDYGVGSYFVGYLPLVDADLDGYGVFDCDDTQADRYPSNGEISGDGVDQDCSGADLLTTDSHEPNNDRASASPLTLAHSTVLEFLLEREIVDQNAGYLDSDVNIDPNADVDWWTATVPARTEYSIDWEGDGIFDLSFFGPDGITSIQNFKNDTDVAQTFYARVTGQGAYELTAEERGQDIDHDGFYNVGWDTDRDCDDQSGSVTPDAANDPCNGSL